MERLRYIDKLKTSGGEILQVSSEIKGTLFEKHIGEVIFNQLPAGSVSGAPKPSTLNIIAKAEGEKRGYYCGVFGYFDGKNLDSAVMIRYIEADDSGNKFFRSGGGITSKSTPEKAYEEGINKIYLQFV